MELLSRQLGHLLSAGQQHGMRYWGLDRITSDSNLSDSVFMVERKDGYVRSDASGESAAVGIAGKSNVCRKEEECSGEEKHCECDCGRMMEGLTLYLLSGTFGDSGRTLSRLANGLGSGTRNKNVSRQSSQP